MRSRLRLREANQQGQVMAGQLGPASAAKSITRTTGITGSKLTTRARQRLTIRLKPEKRR